MDDDELDFDALMAAQGVVPLGPKPKPAPTPAPTQAPAPGLRAKPKPQQTPAPKPPPPAPKPAPLVDPELPRLRARVEALEAELKEARADARASARKVSALRAEAKAREVEVVPLGALLKARGLNDDTTVDLVVQEWADQGWLGELFASLGTTDKASVEHFLSERVSLVCGREECPAQAGSVAVRVEAARCEVCGGSDVRRAARAFFARCAERGVARVRIVGGSPTYHTKLNELAKGEERVHLKLIRGTGKRTLREARQDQKHSDLVILWGGTILDHATSNLYDHSVSRVLTIAHRGMARMLQIATEQL